MIDRSEGDAMATVHDVAAHILQQAGPMSTMKLQKLVYYSQAWHLVWAQEPLFSERIEAWANGPVVRELYDSHRGLYTTPVPWPGGNPSSLTSSQRETIDAIVESYGNLSGRQLSHMTHADDPWRDARRGLGPTERTDREISVVSMAEYYQIVDADENAYPVDELEWPDWYQPDLTE